MKAIFLPILLLSLFATTNAAAGAALCADADAALQSCGTILKTGNLNDPSLDGCCAGLNKIATLSTTIGVQVACQCVHAALDAANTVDISAELQEKCGVNLGFSLNATVSC